MESEKSLVDGWICRKIGEFALVTKLAGFEFTKYVRYSDTEEIPVIRAQNVTKTGFRDGNFVYVSRDLTELLQRSRVTGGDLLMVFVGSVGNVGIVPNGRDYFLGPNVAKIRILDEDILNEFVLLYLMSEKGREAVNKFSKSTVQGSISMGNIREIPVSFPSLLEQIKIVAKIEELFTDLDAGVAALQRAQAGLKRYKASVLKAACEGRLVPQDPSDEPAAEMLHRLGKQPLAGDDLPPLPPGWCWVKLCEIAKRITDGTHQPPKFELAGIPFLFVKHIVSGKISFSDTKFISHATYKNLQARCPIEVGDVLYTAVGSYGVAVPVHTTQPFSFQRHIAFIKPLNIISSDYLSATLNSEVGKKQANLYARGVAQKTVTLGDLSRYAIPLPPQKEQVRITTDIERRMSITDEAERTIETALLQALRLRQSILQQAFTGKLLNTDHPLLEPFVPSLENSIIGKPAAGEF
jgi:type I restriction enzyme S subunit